MSATPWSIACQAPLSSTISQSLLKFMSMESVMPSNHLVLCHPFSSRPHSFSASGSFPMSQLFASGGQSIGASASVLPMNIQDWFPLELTGLISLQSKGLSRVFSNTTIRKHQPSLWSNSHIRTWLQVLCIDCAPLLIIKSSRASLVSDLLSGPAASLLIKMCHLSTLPISVSQAGLGMSGLPRPRCTKPWRALWKEPALREEVSGSSQSLRHGAGARVLRRAQCWSFRVASLPTPKLFTKKI